MKHCDRLLTNMSAEDLKSSLEVLNAWATIDSIVKIPNASSMLKVMFLDVTTATRALSDGLASTTSSTLDKLNQNTSAK